MLRITVHDKFSVRLGRLLIGKISRAFIVEMKLRENFRVSLALVDNATIARWNKRYRHSGVTDVLSFRYLKKNNPLDIFGEIMIAVPYCRATAKKQGLSFSQMFTYLLIHGLLHIWDYDHENDKEAKEMFQMERQIMNHLV